MTPAADRGWTPGPWVVHGSHIYAPDKAIIATVNNPGRKAADYPLVANRDLMAAAPELYEAANEAFDFLGGVDDAADVRGRLLGALLKARGQ